MARYFTVIDGVMECYHLENSGKHVSTVILVDPHTSAGDFAETLHKAAEWFETVSMHKIGCTPPVRLPAARGVQARQQQFQGSRKEEKKQ